MSVCLVREFFESVENSVGAGIDRDWGAIAPCDRALSVEHKQRAFADAFALAIGVIFSRDFALWLEIGEQRKMQMAITCERRMAPYAIHRNAQ